MFITIRELKNLIREDLEVAQYRDVENIVKSLPVGSLQKGDHSVPDKILADVAKEVAHTLTGDEETHMQRFLAAFHRGYRKAAQGDYNDVSKEEYEIFKGALHKRKIMNPTKYGPLYRGLKFDSDQLAAAKDMLTRDQITNPHRPVHHTTLMSQTRLERYTLECLSSWCRLC